MCSTASPSPSPVHFDKIGQIAISVTDLSRPELLSERAWHAAAVRNRQHGVLSLWRTAPRTCTSKSKASNSFWSRTLSLVCPDHDLWIAFLKDPTELRAEFQPSPLVNRLVLCSKSSSIAS
jgi:hypothetical protein